MHYFTPLSSFLFIQHVNVLKMFLEFADSLGEGGKLEFLKFGEYLSPNYFTSGRSHLWKFISLRKKGNVNFLLSSVPCPVIYQLFIAVGILSS